MLRLRTFNDAAMQPSLRTILLPPKILHVAFAGALSFLVLAMRSTGDFPSRTLAVGLSKIAVV
jgi:hypothetical protein